MWRMVNSLDIQHRQAHMYERRVMSLLSKAALLADSLSGWTKNMEIESENAPASTDDTRLERRTGRSALLSLPAEIIDHIITFLPLLSLIDLSATCRSLRVSAIADIHWRNRFHALNIPNQNDSPAPFRNWKE